MLIVSAEAGAGNRRAHQCKKGEHLMRVSSIFTRNRLPIAAILAIAILAVVSAWVVADSRDVIRVSYNPIPLNIPTILMRDRLLQSEMDSVGVEVEWVSGLLKGSLMTEAMATGDLDIASVMGGTSALVSHTGGRDICIVAGFSRAPGGFGIVVRPESPIKSVADLRGKTVVGPIGTEVHYLLAKALQEAGLSLRDVEFRNDLVPNAVNYVLSGSADAALVVEPTMSIHAAKGNVRVLRTGEGLMSGATYVAVRREFLEDHPEVVKRYLRAQVKAIELMMSMGDDVYALASAELGIPESIVAQVASKYAFDASLSAQAIADLQGLSHFLLEAGLIRVSADVSSLVDTTLLQEVLSESGQ